jgi:hypothetical protein
MVASIANKKMTNSTPETATPGRREENGSSGIGKIRSFTEWLAPGFAQDIDIVNSWGESKKAEITAGPGFP